MAYGSAKVRLRFVGTVLQVMAAEEDTAGRVAAG
jgi:hypothetical protein